MKKSSATAAVDMTEVPFLAVNSFRHFPFPFSWMAVRPVGKGSQPLADFERPYRASHVAVERVRRDPTPAALLDLLRSLLPDLRLSPRQTTVYLAWAEVLLREAKDEERFTVGGEDVDRFTLAGLFLDRATPLRGVLPFRWLLPYLEALFALGPSREGSPTAAESAFAALEAATAAGEPLSTRSGLRRFLEAVKGQPEPDPVVQRLPEWGVKQAGKGPRKRKSAKPKKEVKEKKEKRGQRKKKPVRKKKQNAPEDRLQLVTRSRCIGLGEFMIPLTPREFALVRATIEEGSLERNRAAELLNKQPARSGMATPDMVDADAPRDHRKHILAKVEKKAGRAWRQRLATAFRCERGVFLYVPKTLPASLD